MQRPLRMGQPEKTWKSCAFFGVDQVQNALRNRACKWTFGWIVNAPRVLATKKNLVSML